MSMLVVLQKAPKPIMLKDICQVITTSLIHNLIHLLFLAHFLYCYHFDLTYTIFFNIHRRGSSL